MLNPPPRTSGVWLPKTFNAGIPQLREALAADVSASHGIYSDQIREGLAKLKSFLEH